MAATMTAAIEMAMIASTNLDGGRGRISSPARLNVIVWATVNMVTTFDTLHSAARKLLAGFQAVEVDGTVVYRDKDCTANAIFYLNRDHLWLEILPSADQDRLIEAGGFDVAPEDGFSQVPLDMKLEMLAKTGPSDKAEILWQGNLVHV